MKFHPHPRIRIPQDKIDQITVSLKIRSSEVSLKVHRCINTVDGSELRRLHQLSLVVYPDDFQVFFLESIPGEIAGFPSRQREVQMISISPYLKLRFSPLKMDGWKMILSWNWGPGPNFRGENLSFKEGNLPLKNQATHRSIYHTWIWKYFCWTSIQVLWFSKGIPPKISLIQVLGCMIQFLKWWVSPTNP